MQRRALRLSPRLVISVAVVVLLVLSETTHSGTFFSTATMSTLTPFVGVMIIVSAGQGLVVGSGGIDLSIPATMTLVGVIVLKVARIEDGRLGTAIVVALLACVLIGLMNGLIVEMLSLNPFVATLATGQIIVGVARYVRGPVPQFTRVPAQHTEWARTNVGGISVALIIALLIVLVGAAALRSSVWGRNLVASSASKLTATYVGLRASAYRILTYTLCSVLAGVGAVLLSGQLGAPDLSLGAPYLLATVVAVVLSGATLSGGRVDIIGVALGAIFITVLNHNLRVQGYSSGFAQLVQATVLAGGLAAVFVIKNRADVASWLRRLTKSGRPTVSDVPVGT
jgi:ribose transport system permease protein